MTTPLMFAGEARNQLTALCVVDLSPAQFDYANNRGDPKPITGCSCAACNWLRKHGHADISVTEIDEILAAEILEKALGRT